MAAFTTTSPASTYIINTLVLVAVIAIVGVIGSYIMLNHTPADQSVGAVAAPSTTPQAAVTPIRHAD